MRYVYILERRQLNLNTNRYEFYDTEVYSSLKKLNASLDNSMECNKAFDVKVDDEPWGQGTIKTVDYTTMGHLSPTERKAMYLRMIVKKKELR